ncbi:MAG TPA: Mth938-like domain-containing protein [Aestuariivirgaceae bacterium]|nr:Mth938-like domain-containing protein [Aestuariivirgaceae bacterium]
MPIDAYGSGEFRFAGMSHRGALLALPSGIHEWTVKSAAHLAPADFATVTAEKSDIDLLVIGTGPVIAPLPRPVRAHLTDQAIAYELMDTGAALRTYNVLLAEGRRVAGAFLGAA